MTARRQAIALALFCVMIGGQPAEAKTVTKTSTTWASLGAYTYPDPACGAPAKVRYHIPRRARNVEPLEPLVGAPLSSAGIVARVTDIRVGRGYVRWTAVGSAETCTPDWDGQPRFRWGADVRLRVRYELEQRVKRGLRGCGSVGPMLWTWGVRVLATRNMGCRRAKRVAISWRNRVTRGSVRVPSTTRVRGFSCWARHGAYELRVTCTRGGHREVRWVIGD